MGNRTFNTGSLSSVITVDPITLNVGIGGAPTAYKANVTGAVAATNFVLSGATGNTGIYYGHTDRVVLANYTAGGIDFEVNNGAVSMTLFPTGNLAIGTSPTDAGYKLDVAGAGRFTSSITALSETITKSADGIFATYGGNAPKLNLYQFSAGNVMNYGHNFYYNGTNYGLNDNTKMGWEIRTHIGNANLEISSIAAGTTTRAQRFFIDGTNGNTGIGITPSFRLDVASGSSGVVLNLESTNAYNAETGILLSSGRAKISGFLNSGGGTPGSSLRFFTMPDGGSVTETLRITSAGWFGFNSPSPSRNYVFSNPANKGAEGFEINAQSGIVTFLSYNRSTGVYLPLSLSEGTSNVLVGGSVDYGYKLDVFGSARVQGTMIIGNATSASGSVSNPYNTWTTIFTPPGGYASYLVYAFSAGNGADYCTTATIVVNNIAVVMQGYTSSAGLVMRVSGGAVQVLNGSGTTIVVNWNYLKLA